MEASRLAPAATRHEQRVDVGDELMGELASTVPRASDAFADARRRESDEPLAVCDVICLRANDAERVSPLVPGDSRQHHLEASIVQIAERRVDQHQSQLLDPDAHGIGEAESVGRFHRGVTGRSQEIVHVVGKRLGWRAAGALPCVP